MHDATCVRQALMDEGATKEELYELDFKTMARYPRLYNDYKAAKAKLRNPKTKVFVHVFWGGAGGGKSTAAWNYKTRAEAKGHTVFWREGEENNWWSGYTGQDVVILNEFSWEDVKINILKSWLDRFPAKVAGKGENYVPLTATRFLITCQHSPIDWYPKATMADRKAIIRRLDTIRHYPSENDNKSLAYMVAERSGATEEELNGLKDMDVTD